MSCFFRYVYSAMHTYVINCLSCYESNVFTEHGWSRACEILGPYPSATAKVQPPMPWGTPKSSHPMPWGTWLNARPLLDRTQTHPNPTQVPARPLPDLSSHPMPWGTWLNTQYQTPLRPTQTPPRSLPDSSQTPRIPKHQKNRPETSQMR